MYYVYILKSVSIDRHYTGSSKYRGKRRRQHLGGRSHWTSRADDWKELYCIAVATRKEAVLLERKIKARGAKRFLQNMSASQPRRARQG